MRRSAYFLPTLKETPAEAQIVSHRLMLRAGMIRQASAGIYSWLPLGLRVLKKIEAIVRFEQDAAGCQDIPKIYAFGLYFHRRYRNISIQALPNFDGFQW